MPSPEPIFYDSHMHTPLCRHAVGEPETYAASAVERGLKGIIFTCHSPMPDGWGALVRMYPEELDAYFAMVERTRVVAEGKLDVRLGMESDYFPGMEPWLEELHAKADFDYILGSVHYFLDEWEPLFPLPNPIDRYFGAYFDHLAGSAETGVFDCLAHPDLIKNANPQEYDFAAIREAVCRALDRIATTGVAMELNTSGLNKRLSQFNPSPEILALMQERGIPVVLGSDSHHPLRIGADFETALDNLETAGYSEVSFFLERKRQSLAIDAVRASLKPGITVSYHEEVPLETDEPALFRFLE